ncbi:MAG: BrnT family toxin [Alphaproteobacteria bacterium]
MRGGVAGFDWDTGNWPKCGKHGVSKAEIEHVLRSGSFVLPDRHPQDRETRFDAVGKNEAGRYVFVVFAVRERAGERLLRPISARYMHRKEIENYERQQEAFSALRDG